MTSNTSVPRSRPTSIFTIFLLLFFISLPFLVVEFYEYDRYLKSWYPGDSVFHHLLTPVQPPAPVSSPPQVQHIRMSGPAHGVDYGTPDHPTPLVVDGSLNDGSANHIPRDIQGCAANASKTSCNCYDRAGQQVPGIELSKCLKAVEGGVNWLYAD